jgi:hypothetical protein
MTTTVPMPMYTAVPLVGRLTIHDQLSIARPGKPPGPSGSAHKWPGNTPVLGFHGSGFSVL